MRTGGSFLGIKWPEREDDHQPPHSEEVENELGFYLHSAIHINSVVVFN
jgi:hypothetical protein